MTTTTQNFGALIALDVTNLQSLANDAFWQSDVIDNSVIKGIWMEVFVTILTTTTAANINGTVDMYIAGSVDGGSDFSGNASGVEGIYTPVANSDNGLDPIGSVAANASEVTARTFRQRFVVYDIGEHFALLAQDKTGSALGATINAVEYRIHKYDTL